PRHVRRQTQRPPPRPDLQGIRTAQVPRPTPRPGLHPRPTPARALGLRLLRRHPHRRRPRTTTTRHTRLRRRIHDRHRPRSRIEIRRTTLTHTAGPRATASCRYRPLAALLLTPVSGHFGA